MPSAAQMRARRRFARASRATRRGWARKAAHTRATNLSRKHESLCVDRGPHGVTEPHISDCRDFMNPLDCCGVNPRYQQFTDTGYHSVNRIGNKAYVVTIHRDQAGSRAEAIDYFHRMVAPGAPIKSAKKLPDGRWMVVARRGAVRRSAPNPELLVWSTEGGTMSANPGTEEIFEENPRKRRKKRKSRSRRKGRSCHRVKGYRSCRKGGRRGSRRHARRSSHRIKRGRRLLTWKGAVKRYGVKGAMKYRRSHGIKKLKG